MILLDVGFVFCNVPCFRSISTIENVWQFGVGPWFDNVCYTIAWKTISYQSTHMPYRDTTLVQVIRCCVTAPSHLPDQCWPIITSEVAWQSLVNNFTKVNSTVKYFPWGIAGFTLDLVMLRYSFLQNYKRNKPSQQFQWCNSLAYITLFRSVVNGGKCKHVSITLPPVTFCRLYLNEATWCVFASLNKLRHQCFRKWFRQIWRQVMIGTNISLLIIAHLGTNFGDICIKIQQISLTKAVAKVQPYCHSPNVLNNTTIFK